MSEQVSRSNPPVCSQQMDGKSGSVEFDGKTYPLITGLHEIHITCSPDDLFKLRMYCMDKNLKPILAVAKYGDTPIQPMFSKFKHGTSQQVLDKAHQMADEMSQIYDIFVTRVKVEAMMHNDGVPKEPNQYDDEIYASEDTEYYFEFHLKIPVKGSEEWNELERVCKQKNAHLSFNAFKKETIPLITLRLSANLGSIKAVQIKDELLDHLKANGFHTNDGIQCEFSVYDSNPVVDSGWLF